MRICLQGAALDTHNMGVSALAVGSVRAILHRYPEAEVFFLNYEKAPTTYTIALAEREVAVPLVNMRFSWRFWLRNNVAFLLFLTALMKLLGRRSQTAATALRRKWIAGNNCLRHLDESDLVLAISGGDSFADIYGLGRMLYVSLPQILALWAGKRLILLPQTLGPFKSRLAKAVAKYIMKRAEAVYSRDYEGVRTGFRSDFRTPVESIGLRKPEGQGTGVSGTGVRSQELGVSSPIPNLRGEKSRNPTPDTRNPIFKARHPKPESRIPIPKVRFCYDVGFLVDPIPPARMDIVGFSLAPNPGLSAPNTKPLKPNPCPFVGLNVSGLLFMGGYTRRNMFGLKVEYDKFIYHLIDFLIQQKNADVLLVPHVFGQLGESDSPACARIYEALKEKYPGKIGWVRGSYNQSEIKYIIGQCDFFVGSRMHACIAAVSQCVPAVAIAYSDKFIGVMETVGAEAAVADARKMDEAEILETVERAFEQRNVARRQLEQRMPQIKERVLRLFDEIGGEGGTLPGESQRAGAGRAGELVGHVTTRE
ncbi:MAG: polysaccharide pyruvyl transferase family protein [Terriglobia bacterium]|jgi:polysaccharide pyruvyl transferase WcaK-like protein